MATPRRSRACMRAWICGATFEHHATLSLPLQAPGVRRGPGATRLDDLRRIAAVRRQPGCRPGEEARARMRQARAHLPAAPPQRAPGENPPRPAAAAAPA